MVLVKANTQSEAGDMPSAEQMSQMSKFNQQLIDAGILLDANGLQPSKSSAARVAFSGSKRTVIDGPFTETKELVAGYWIWQCKSLEEAIEWVKRCPNPHPGDSEIEIRRIWELSEIPDVPEQVKRMRDTLEASKKA
jgi:hypothetical protein